MSQAVTLLISSDDGLRKALGEIVPALGPMTLQTADSVAEMFGWLELEELTFVVLHLKRGAEADELKPAVAELVKRSIPHCMVLDENRPKTQYQVMEMGVLHTFPRPLDLNRLAFWIDNLTVRKRFDLAAKAAAADATTQEVDGFLYHPEEMGVLMEQVRMVAPQSTTVLIGGETGTGKTRLARLIHNLSNRRNEPFMVVNCATLSATVIESELFGHVRGSFTGADRDRPGKFAEVGKGTLFLDDIDTLPPSAQMKLLRAVEDRMFEPVGSNKATPVLARLIAASNRNLEDDVHQGKFRSDLFYRLNVVTFTLPPLRARRSMIEELAKKFTLDYAQQNQRPVCGVTPEAMKILREYFWPGNIRELRNVIERAVALCPRPLISKSDLPPHVAAPQQQPPMQQNPGAPNLGQQPLTPGVPYGYLSGPQPSSVNLGALMGGSASSSSILAGANPSQGYPVPGGVYYPPGAAPPGYPGAAAPPAGAANRAGGQGTLAEMKDEAELEAIMRALAQSDNNKSLAAQALGISRPTLYKKLRRYGLLGENDDG